MDTLPNDFKPIDGHLENIYKSLPDVTLGEEQGRLRERFLELGSKILAIDKIMGERSEHTIPTEDLEYQQAV